MKKHPDFHTLLVAQLNTVSPCADTYFDFASDDRWDYLRGALALSSDMLEIDMDGADGKQLLDLLNLRPWENYACDGIANEIYAWLESLGDTDYWFEELDDDHKWETLPEVKR